MSRTVPRLFLFDCCDGDAEVGSPSNLNVADVVLAEEDDVAVDAKDTAQDDADTSAANTHSDVEYSVSSEDLWAYNTEHPDYQLAELNASTWGFQSKHNTVSGSYLISGFVEKAEKELTSRGYVPHIGGLFKEVQDELMSRKKQLPYYIWNSNTENIQLFKRPNDGFHLGMMML